MKRKKPYIRLTNSEFAMMQLLWEAGRPLNRAEIMEIALRDPENPLFAKIYESQKAYVESVSDWSEAATAK